MGHGARPINDIRTAVRISGEKEVENRKTRTTPKRNEKKRATSSRRRPCPPLGGGEPKLGPALAAADEWFLAKGRGSTNPLGSFLASSPPFPPPPPPTPFPASRNNTLRSPRSTSARSERVPRRCPSDRDAVTSSPGNSPISALFETLELAVIAAAAAVRHQIEISAMQCTLSTERERVFFSWGSVAASPFPELTLA